MDRFTYPSPMASGSIDHCQGSYASQEEEEQSNQHFRPAEMPNEAQVPTVHVPVPVPAQMYQSALPYSGPGPTCMDHLPIYVPVTQIPLSHLLPLSSTGPIDSSIPALDFNGYILYAATGVPEELIREPTGESIAEPGSILDEESGRTFVNHDTGRYFFPNDAAEQDRLDLQHKLFKLFLNNQLYRAPIASPKRVLDIATGTGIWAIQFANEHPQANVIGTDISLIQPDGPPNVSWVREDAENQEWTLPHLFDYIHVRAVLSCFDNHRIVIQKAYDSLEPGGWLEMMDPTFQMMCTDGTCTGTNIERYWNLILEAGRSVGRDFCVATKYRQWLNEIGFVDVVEEVGPMPGNPWPSDPRFKEIGRWVLVNTQKGFRGWCWKLFREIGMSPEEIETLVSLAKAEVENTDLHCFFPMHVVYGRKPFAWEAAPHKAV